MSVVRAATCAVISYCSTHIPPTRGTNTNMNCSTGICSYVNGVSLPPMIGIMTVSPMIGIITVSPTFLLPVRQKRYVNCQLMPTKTLPINGDINYSDSLLSYFLEVEPTLPNVVVVAPAASAAAVAPSSSAASSAAVEAAAAADVLLTCNNHRQLQSVIWITYTKHGHGLVAYVVETIATSIVPTVSLTSLVSTIYQFTRSSFCLQYEWLGIIEISAAFLSLRSFHSDDGRQ